MPLTHETWSDIGWEAFPTRTVRALAIQRSSQIGRRFICTNARLNKRIPCPASRVAFCVFGLGGQEQPRMRANGQALVPSKRAKRRRLPRRKFMQPVIQGTEGGVDVPLNFLI